MSSFLLKLLKLYQTDYFPRIIKCQHKDHAKCEKSENDMMAWTLGKYMDRVGMQGFAKITELDELRK